MGDISFSSALLRKEKHSMSSMCTSSMNKTPGTMSALPSSRHSATLESICSRTSCRISPVSPANNARKPWNDRCAFQSRRAGIVHWYKMLQMGVQYTHCNKYSMRELNCITDNKQMNVRAHYYCTPNSRSQRNCLQVDPSTDLRSAVDDINFMKCDHMHHFLPLL